MPEPLWKSDYFRGWRAHKPHPMMTSTGSEGRCDICGSSAEYVHQPPWERATEEELAREKALDARASGIPLARPQFAWEMEPRSGEGSAGGYLKHLRERGYVRVSMKDITERLVEQYGLAVTSGYRTTGAVSGRYGNHAHFTEHYGMGRERLQEMIHDTLEATMQQRASITITVEGEKWLDIVHALLDLKDYDGITITNIEDTGVQAAVADAVTTAVESDEPVMLTRRYMTDQAVMEPYLSRAMMLPGGAPEMEITYVSVTSGERTIRKAIPVSWGWQHGRKALYIKDVRSGGHRTFYLDKIQAVEGPVL